MLTLPTPSQGDEWSECPAGHERKEDTWGGVGYGSIY